MVDYEKLIIEEKKKNYREGKISQKQIKSFIKESPFDKDEVLQKVKNDVIFAWVFTKAPIKQSFHENTAAKFIQQIPGVYNFKNLRTDEKVIVSGAVVEKKLMPENQKPDCKSLDFEWEFKNKLFYASHKYTKEAGGGQDNQFEDLKKFIISANKCIETGFYFIVIADGEFYSIKVKKTKITKLQTLKNMCNQRNTFALNILELEKLMNDIVK